MTKQGVHIRHIIQTPDLDSSVSSTTEQLMCAVSEDQPCDYVFVAGAAAERSDVLLTSRIPDVYLLVTATNSKIPAGSSIRALASLARDMAVHITSQTVLVRETIPGMMG